MGVLIEADTSVAPHAVSEVDTKTFPGAAHIAEGAVVDRFLTGVIVEVTDAAAVLRKGLDAPFTLSVRAGGSCRLESTAYHTHNFSDLVAIERGITILRRQITFLFATEATRVQPARRGMTKFASSCIMWTPEYSSRGAIVVGGSKFRRREEGNTFVRWWEAAFTAPHELYLSRLVPFIVERWRSLPPTPCQNIRQGRHICPAIFLRSLGRLRTSPTSLR